MMLLAAFFTLKKLIIAVSMVLAYVFGSPLLILTTFRQQANPQIERVGESTTLPSFISEQFDEADVNLKGLGFQLDDTLYIPQQTDNVRIVLRLYTNRTAQDFALVVTMLALVEGTWSVATQYFEFSSHFLDGSDFNTNNSGEVSAFKTPEKTITTRAPWIQDCNELYEAHCLIMQSEAGSKAKELRLVTKYNGDAVEFLSFAMKEEMENAAGDGYLKLTPDGEHYVPTVGGAYMMSWGQLWPFKLFVESNANRNSRARLSSVGFEPE